MTALVLAQSFSMNAVLGLTQLLALGFVIAVVLGTAATLAKLMKPPRRTYADAVRLNRPGDPSELDTPRAFEERTFDVAGRTLSGWVIEGDAHSHSEQSGLTVIFVHGWASSKMSILPRLGAFAPHAVRIVAIDLPGHGESPGRCTLGVREPAMIDALASELAREFELESHQFVLAGSSLGAGVAIAAAGLIEARTNKPIAAVIAEGVYRVPWTPARAVLRQSAKPAAITGRLALWSLGIALGVGPRFSGFDRAAHARKLLSKVLVVQGSRDTISPPEDGKAVAEAAASDSGSGRFVSIEGAAHHELWTDEHAPATSVAIDDCLRSIGSPVVSPDKQAASQAPA